VVVPESIRDEVLRALTVQIRKERAANGGQAPVRTEVQLFLMALSRPDRAPETPPSSVNGTSAEQPVKLLLTTQDLADRMGCSVRYARRVAARIGTKVGRQWLITEQDLHAS
jgi:hypothetical protein